MSPLKPNIGTERYQRVRLLKPMLLTNRRLVDRGTIGYAVNRRGNLIDVSFTKRGRAFGVNVLDVQEVRGPR